ncbi:MAG: type II toxin-antitoxin system RelE/ParE family toxin [Proteobacteria bacterium]|nr:type II toxin-antitoxin system RelE/ParE family toxin [Pseudomonadota bacterium]
MNNAGESGGSHRAALGRVIFCVADDKMVLHGFIKKTQKMPKADLDLALKRMKEVSK